MPGWTPYRHGFNNPILYADPTGLFETRREARRYKRSEGVDGTVHRNKAEDGTVTYSIDNKNTGHSVTKIDGEIVESDIMVKDKAISSAEYGHSSLGAMETSLLGGAVTLKGISHYNPISGYWQGKNGQSISMQAAAGKSKPFTGNGSTGGIKTVALESSKLRGLGSTLGSVSMALTQVEYAVLMNTNPGPNLKKYYYRKLIADQGMNAVGFIGLRGAVFSFGYNSGYGIESICNCNIQYNPITKDFTPIEQTLFKADQLGYQLRW